MNDLPWYIGAHSLDIIPLSASFDEAVIQTERLTSGRMDERGPSPRSTNWWLGRMIALHSSLRCARFRIMWQGIRSDAAQQLVRTTTGMTQTMMRSSRPDVTGKPRPEGIYATDLLIDTDPEGWIHLCGQRLCVRAEGTTQAAVQAAADQMRESFSPFFLALGTLSVPRCERSLRCPELRGCGRYPRELQKWGGACLQNR